MDGMTLAWGCSIVNHDKPAYQLWTQGTPKVIAHIDGSGHFSSSFIHTFTKCDGSAKALGKARFVISGTLRWGPYNARGITPGKGSGTLSVTYGKCMTGKLTFSGKNG